MFRGIVECPPVCLGRSPWTACSLRRESFMGCPNSCPRNDVGNALALFATREGRSAAAGVVGDDQRESLVLRAAPDRRLTGPRVADDRDVPRVDLVVRFQVVEHAARAPAPSGEGTPCAGFGRLFAEGRPHAVLEPVRTVGIHGIEVEGRRRIAAGDDLPNGPETVTVLFQFGIRIDEVDQYECRYGFFRELRHIEHRREAATAAGTGVTQEDLTRQGDRDTDVSGCRPG
jgi:hypothetical protein